MRNILIAISLFISFTKLNAAQFSMTAHVYYSVDKTFELSENKQVWYWHNRGILTTSFGINAKSQCRGTSRLANNEMTEQVFICEAIDSEGEKFITEFNSLKGNDTAGVQKFSIVSGTGRWREVIGVQCKGAYSQITPFEDGTLSNATSMWKGKCDVADNTLDRLINYKN